MQSRKRLLIILAIPVFGFLIYHTSTAKAASKSDIIYPVQELNGCQNETRCRAYCSKPENSRACLIFVKKYNLASPEEIANWEKFIDVVIRGGPGSCRNEKECINYCQDSSHIVECFAFVKKYDLVSGKDLEDMSKIASAVQAGAKLPGNCQSKANCLSYCEDTAHIEECTTFAEKAGFISKDEADEARKFAPFIAKGETPGRCTRKDQCEAYCAKPAHIRECIAFAEKANILQPQQLEEAKKVLPFIERGETPGGCISKDQCEAYCAIGSHLLECINFAEKAGFVSKEDADLIRKVGGKTPGNCRSKEACEAYCKDESHIDECVDFAVKAGLINQDEAAYAKKYKITGGPGGCKSKVECESFCATPKNRITCLSWAASHGTTVLKMLFNH